MTHQINLDHLISGSIINKVKRRYDIDKKMRSIIWFLEIHFLFIQNLYSALFANERALMRYSVMDVDKCNYFKCQKLLLRERKQIVYNMYEQIFEKKIVPIMNILV